MTDEQQYVRLRDIKLLGFGQADAERLLRRAARKHGAFKTGRATYVTVEALEDVISEARVRTT